MIPLLPAAENTQGFLFPFLFIAFPGNPPCRVFSLAPAIDQEINTNSRELKNWSKIFG